MKNNLKLVIFAIVFSLGFYLLRTQGHYIYYDIGVLTSDLGGLTYLYSTVGLIFAIFSAFVILSESERWNNLVDTVKGEVGEVKELWLWSRHLPEHLKVRFDQDIKKYLEVLIKEEWGKSELGEKSMDAQKVLASLHSHIYEILKESPDLMPTAFSTFTDILKYREGRIHYTSFHLPKLLKRTLVFSDLLLVALSFLIGVHNIWLDYIFLLGVSMLGFLIYILVDDLDNPTRPGGYHLTPKDYESLLDEIRAESV